MSHHELGLPGSLTEPTADRYSTSILAECKYLFEGTPALGGSRRE
jgi:hypothetical protein